MAVKYNRSPVASVPAINNELQKIQVALEDAVSRTGTAPNQLEATLDANSQRIINLPEPVTNTEPVRKADFDDLGNKLRADVYTAVRDAEDATDDAIAATNSANAAASNANTATSNAYQAIADLESDGYAVINQIESDGESAIQALRVVNAGSFEDGATLTARNEVLYYLAEQTYYRWDGALPKTVPPASTPASTGGVGVGAWVDVGDATLRSELTNPDKGAAMLARGVVSVDSIVDLLSLPPGQIKEGLQYLVRGFYPGEPVDGLVFDYIESVERSKHNGISIISPNAIWDGEHGGLNSFFEFSDSGFGCFVKRQSDSISVLAAGAKEDLDNSVVYNKILGLFDTVKWPAGTFPGDLYIRRENARIIGSGKRKTFIPPISGHKLSALYVRITDANLSPSDSFTGTAIATQIVGGGGTRYLTLERVACQQNTTAADCLLDIRTINSFAGYCRFIDTQIRGGKTAARGVDGDLISDLEINGGTYTRSGEFCLDLKNVQGAVLNAVEFNRGGQDVDVEANPVRYNLGGGLRLDSCERVTINSPWVEYNIDTFKGVFSQNSIYCTDNCRSIVVRGLREVRDTTYGFAFWPANMAMNWGLDFSGSVGNPIFPRLNNNIIKNPRLIIDGGLLTDWVVPDGTSVSRETETQKWGNKYTKIANTSGSGWRIVHQLIADAGSENLDKIIQSGKVTFSILFRIPYDDLSGINNNLTETGQIRFGVASGTLIGALGPMGCYRAATREGLYNEWVYGTVVIDVENRSEALYAVIALDDGAEIDVAGISFAAGNGAAIWE